MPTLIHDIASPLQAVLILTPHDWGAGCSITSRFSTRVATARTGLDSRSSDYVLPRHDFRLDYLLDATEAAELRARLLSLAGDRLALPLWIDDAANDANWGTWAIFSGPTITYDYTAGTYTIGVGAQARRASLLYCRLRGTPTLQAISGTHAIISLDVFEDCPDSLALGYNALGGETPGIPNPDWSDGIEESYSSQVEYEEIGRGRESAVRGDEATVRRGQRAGFVLDRSDARKLLRYWASVRGGWQSFTMPLWFAPVSATNITARFGADELTLDFDSPSIAQAEAEFIEEVATVVGTPAQASTPRAFLYRLQWEGASTAMTWTSWESSLVRSSVTYVPQKITHRSLKEALAIEGDSVEIVCDNFDGCPLRAFILLELERRLLAEIYECDPSSPSTALQVFGGAVSRVRNEGGSLVGICDALGGLLDRKLPRFFTQRLCNYTLYSDLCGVSAATHKETGTVASISGSVIDVTTAAADAADYFASGWALFGTGDTAERRAIVRSEPIVGGQRLTLHRPLKQTGALAVDFYPGCSGEFDAGGCAKFGNQDRFGGAPRQPAYIEAVATGYKPKTGK
jgi:hypothetical protein